MKIIPALLIVLILSLILTPCSYAARIAEADEPASEAQTSSDQKVTIDFVDVDLRVVAKFISELLKKNFIFDRQVQGKVTVYSPAKVSPTEAYRLFESVLEVHGFTTVPYDDYIKIIPSLKAKTKAIETGDRFPSYKKAGDRMVTQLIRLEHANAIEVRKLLTPLLDKTGVMMAYDQGNIIIITDFASNISRLVGIVKAIDVEGEGAQLKLIPLMHASAKDLARELEQLTRGKGKTPGRQTFNVVPDVRTNTLIIMARPGQLLAFMDLIQKLDTPAPRGAANVHVYFLENALAEDLANVLNDLAGKDAQVKTDAQRSGGQRQVFLQEQVTIVAEKSNNALLIRAETQDYKVLSSIIKELDIQRAQVLVEGLIMELTFRKSLALGAEWRALNMPPEGSDATTILGGTNLPTGTNTQGLLNQLAANPLASPSGLILGAARGTLSFGGVSFLNLGLLIQALQTDSEVNILSTPHLLTMDNEEATIIVGEERPFLKSSTLDQGEVTKTFDFKDLGITLKITPQTSKGKFVKLKVFLQIKNFVAEAETGAVTSTKREAETTVMVADGETVVIGGLIRDDTQQTKTSVPCLGQIPVLGWLFKSRSDLSDKTNLMILITPTIIRSPEKLREITLEKQKQAEDARKKHQKEKKDEYKKTLEIIKE
ncbi:MAG: type II secretion system secretin GspD [Deltaproteobacteria bacterium]|nr:type II secretion system secretin GspD [Deltaproteobacteria bacterium]MBW2052589.1 type II secretion system secretin GspD [Deltaproteobacteria bacterium]MBW2323179.1 type II secretion system secretin GspD [Deltaproteobacteria bacterium]